jgi:hypothetical protein
LSVCSCCFFPICVCGVVDECVGAVVLRPAGAHRLLCVCVWDGGGGWGVLFLFVLFCCRFVRVGCVVVGPESNASPHLSIHTPMFILYTDRHSPESSPPSRPSTQARTCEHTPIYTQSNTYVYHTHLKVTRAPALQHGHLRPAKKGLQLPQGHLAGAGLRGGGERRGGGLLVVGCSSWSVGWLVCACCGGVLLDVGWFGRTGGRKGGGGGGGRRGCFGCFVRCGCVEWVKAVLKG